MEECRRRIERPRAVQRQPRAQSPLKAEAPADSPTAFVLDLQRKAGNRAVSGVLLRQTGTTWKATGKKPPATPGPSSDVGGKLFLGEGTYSVVKGVISRDKLRVGTVEAHFAGTGKAAKPSSFPATYTDASGKEVSADLLQVAGERSFLRTGTSWLVKAGGRWTSPGSFKKQRGFAKYGGGRLVDKLRDMQERGVLKVEGKPTTLTEEQLYILQGMANVESNGEVAGVNTYDNMVVSMGFKQVVLGYGSLQDLIGIDRSAFARYGIELGPGTYTIKGDAVPQIKGVDDPQELRGPYWAERFFAAGLDEDVINAELTYGFRALGSFEKELKKRRKQDWVAQLEDPTARAWLFEMKNNRGKWSYEAARRTVKRAQGGKLSRDEFLDVLAEEIEAVYVDKEKDPEEGRKKARNIVRKIPRDIKAYAKGRPASTAVSGSKTKGAASKKGDGASGSWLLGLLPEPYRRLLTDQRVLSQILAASRQTPKRASPDQTAEAVLQPLPPEVRRQLTATAGELAGLVAWLRGWGDGKQAPKGGKGTKAAKAKGSASAAAQQALLTDDERAAVEAGKGSNRAKVKKEMEDELGGPDGVRAWFAGIEPDATFLGIPIGASAGSAVSGAHKELRQRLDLVAEAMKKRGVKDAVDVGLTDMSGLRAPKTATGGSLPSMHVFGLAVDVNYTENPFVRQVSQYVIDRATMFVHGQRLEISRKSPGEAWEHLNEAHEALITYFGLRKKGAGAIEPLLAKLPEKERHDAAWWLAKIEEDYELLRKHDDFASANRDPAEGIMNLSKDLVEALVNDGKLTWGGQYARKSGKDIMHFDWRGGSVGR